MNGGNSRHFHFNDSNWNFDAFSTFITPADDVSRTTDSSYSDEEIENSSVSSSASLDDQSTNTLEEQPTVTNDGSLQNEAQIHDGNVLLYLPHLDEALQSNACCKQCAERNSFLLIEQFVAFCDLECKSML